MRVEFRITQKQPPRSGARGLPFVSMKEGWLSTGSVVSGSGASGGSVGGSGAHLSIASSEED
jgi:hypothetical protein